VTTAINSNLRPPDDASPVLIHFDYDAYAKFEVAQPIQRVKNRLDWGSNYTMGSFLFQ